MRQRYTLDSSALLAWLKGEPRGERVGELVASRRMEVTISAVALAESLVIIERTGGSARANESLAVIRTAQILIVPVDEEIALASRELRIRYGLNTADSLIAATAALTKSVLLTRDGDFRAVSRKLRVQFLL